MRPYIAIVIDSFREALASRILWVLLILATMLLAGLAPLGLESVIYPDITMHGIIDPDGLMQKVLKEKEGAGAVSHRLWTRLPDELQSSLAGGIVQWQKQDAQSRYFMVARALNDILRHPDFYEKSAWGRYELTPEITGAVSEIDALDEYDLMQLNRRLLACAYPDHLPLPESFMCRATYFGLRSSPFPGVKEKFVREGLLGFVNFFVGVVGIFLSILLTAGMVPRTFEAGSVDLLLSKPVSRSGVFLARYCGGCSFIAVMSAYFIVGMFFIGGRLGVWTPRLLLCIPILVFNFAVFFSVSAFLGVYTRNVVISVLLTIFFWFICFSAGLTHMAIKSLLVSRSTTAIIPAGDTTFAVNGIGQFRRWVPETRDWNRDFVRGALNQNHSRIQPVYDRVNKRVLGFFESYLITADAEGKWIGKQTSKLPPHVAKFAVHPDGKVYAVTDNEILLITVKEVKVVSDALRLGFPTAAEMDPATGDFAILARGKLRMLKRGEAGRFTEAAIVENSARRATIGFTKSRIIVGGDESQVQFYDRNLKLIKSVKTPGKEKIRRIASSPDGSMAALILDNDELYLIREGADELERAPVSGQGTVTAVTFADAKTLMIGCDITHIDTYEIPAFKRVKSIRPSMDFLERLFRFGIRPMYTVFPKPSELTNLGIYFVTGETRVGGPQGQIRISIWPPIYSCVIFTIFMLGISCFHISRKDY